MLKGDSCWWARAASQSVKRWRRDFLSFHIPFSLLNATRHRGEAAIVAGAGERGKVTIATNMAGRGTDIKLGSSVAGLVGLHVLATERHESRRIDRQLYGRAARQGEIGSAQAFVSMEDELLRRFAPGIVRRQVKRAVRQRLALAELLAGASLARAHVVTAAIGVKGWRVASRVSPAAGSCRSF